MDRQTDRQTDMFAAHNIVQGLHPGQVGGALLRAGEGQLHQPMGGEVGETVLDSTEDGLGEEGRRRGRGRGRRRKRRRRRRGRRRRGGGGRGQGGV